MFCAKCRYINGDKAADRVSVNYSYDGNGNLIGREEKINGVQENSRTYLLDYTSDNPEILEEALSETSGVRYVYGADNERIYATVNSGDISETYTLNTDVRGSTRWATDSKGNIVANTTYDSYGNVTENKKLSLAEGDYDITTNYTHHTYDDIMETYNAGARTYMPKQARFLQKDPVAGVTTEPQTLNNYVYCLDNPVNYTDPDGCFAVPNIGAGISSAVKSAGNAIGNYATSAGSKLGKIAATARENAAGTFASVVCNTAKGIAWTLDKAMKVGAYIDKMPFAAKVAIGTAGFAIAVGAGAVSLPTAAFIGFTSLAGGATAGAIGYAVNSAVTNEWNNKDFVHSVVNGALTNYMLAGATTGVGGIVNAVKSGKVTRFLGDEAGSVGVKGDNIPIGATFEGRIYRSVNSAYDPLEMSQYTINSNHRYTEKGIPGLYFSSSEEIVRAELGNYDVFDFSNRTMYSYDVKLTNMLDVSNPSVHSQLGISLDSIVGESYDVTHAIGRYAYSNGYNGIIAPSARADGGVNIILFNAKGVK